MHEDPCLVLLFEQLRSRSLQTVKGAVAVPGHTEFNVSSARCLCATSSADTDSLQFILHMSRVLCRMGKSLSLGDRVDCVEADHFRLLQAVISWRSRCCANTSSSGLNRVLHQRRGCSARAEGWDSVEHRPSGTLRSTPTCQVALPRQCAIFLEAKSSTRSSSASRSRRSPNSIWTRSDSDMGLCRVETRSCCTTSAKCSFTRWR